MSRLLLSVDDCVQFFFFLGVAIDVTEHVDTYAVVAVEGDQLFLLAEWDRFYL